MKDQFDDFDRFLGGQRQILERASRYLDDQPRPLAQYLEDEQRAIEQVFRDLGEKLEPLGRYLKEQPKLLEAMTEPRVTEGFDLLASYCGERHAALEGYASAGEYRPQAPFAALDEIYQKYRTQEGGRNKLMARLLEQNRQADTRLQESLKLLSREQEDPRPVRLEAASYAPRDSFPILRASRERSGPHDGCGRRQRGMDSRSRAGRLARSGLPPPAEVFLDQVIQGLD